MKKVLSLIIAFVLCISSLISCEFTPGNDDPETPPVSPGDGENPIADRTNVPDENYTPKGAVFSMGNTEEDDFINLFSPDVRVELKLDITPEQLSLLQADYERYSSFGSKSPIYRKANLTVKMTLPNGREKQRFIEEVGVRMKGNTSRTSFYNEHDGIYNLIHLKLDFGETFDDEEYYGDSAKVWTDSAARKARKNRTFATLEKIDLRWNKEDDATYIREIYSFDAYREMGVLAPHVNLASLDMGGEHLGVFTINEPIDEIFLEKNLPEELLGGDLYKCGWGMGGGANFSSSASIGIEDEDNGLFYCYDLKTNKKTSTHQALNYFISEINKKNVSKERVAELMDVENFVNFAAISWFLGNPDDLRNNYNNYYLYFTPEGKAMFIPYDYDRTMGISHDWNPTGHGMTKDDPLTKDMGAGGKQGNAVYLLTVVKGGHYVNEYMDALSRIASSTIFSNARFTDRYERAKKLYSAYTEPSKDFHNDGGHHTYFDINITADPSDGGGNISYSDYMKLKLETLHKALEPFMKPSTDSGENGDNAGSETYEIEDYYIRADFTNWEIKDGYKMSSTDGKIYTYDVNVSNENRLKVYYVDGESWLGEESMSSECTVSYTTDHHGNIVLGKGQYTIIYNAETKLINIVER